jgi:23S rRNA (uracil1939-C5)-methyltransferase
MATTKENSPVEIEIEKLVYGGDGLARLDGQVVLMPYVLPGERVAFRPQRMKAGLLKGTQVQILRPSPERIKPRCEYFTLCGGCHLQQAGYAFQRAQKVSILRETLRRIGGLEYAEEIPVISGEPWAYRNRIQLHFKAGTCGFHKAESHAIQGISHCDISAPLLNEAIAKIQPAVKKQEWPDFLRSLELFTNGTEIQVNVLESNRPVAARFFTWLKEMVPAIAAGAIDYEAAGERFRISGGSFFQTNRFLVDALVNEVLGDESGEEAVDLYAGVGLFTLPIAKRFQRVKAVERGATAYRDLEFNAEAAKLTNITAQKAAAEDFLRELQTAPTWMIADPPRAGLGKDATTEILRLKPERLTLVSCDPATLARDLKALLEGGYAISRMSLVDLFPQTYHFETVVRLKSEILAK